MERIQKNICLAGEYSSRPANNERLLLDTTFVLYVYVYHYSRYMPSNTNLGMPSSIIGILVVCFLTCSAGVLSQFSPPSGDICPGSDIEFSCVGNSLSVSTTRWEITPDGGGDSVCTVAHNFPGEMDSCGPGDIFTLSLDVNAAINYTSSLRAEDVPLSLNGTVVECVDGADARIFGSTNICIVGKYNTDPIIKWSHSPINLFRWCIGVSRSPVSHSLRERCGRGRVCGECGVE